MFRKIFIIHVLILILSIAFIETYVTRVIRENQIRSIREHLAGSAALIGEKIPFNISGNIDDLCRELKKSSGARVTVVLPDGRVIGDSDESSSVMDNHGNRPEIRQLLTSPVGWSIRRSSTVSHDLLYVAIPFPGKDMPQGYVRLSVPLEDVDSAVNSLRFKILLPVIGILFFSAAVLVWQTKRIGGYVTRIIGHSKLLAQGEFEKKIYLDNAGEFEEIAGNLNTMAEELKTNIEERNDETHRLNVILKSVPDALLITDELGTIVLANDAADSFFPDKRITGRQFGEVMRNPEVFELFDNIREGNASVLREITTDTPEEKSIIVRMAPLFYREKEFAGAVIIFRDHTRMKKLEQVRKDFVANVSHEIKTPVTAIKGFAETLLDGAIDDRENARHFLETIRAHSERLNRLVEDLLMISRLELGVVRVRKEDVDVTEVMKSVITMLAGRAESKGLVIKQTVTAEPHVIRADRDRLEQILLNLVDNALKFTSEGEIEIGLGEDSTGTNIFVRDTGIGVPEKYLGRLGERFFRTDPSRSRELGGTGLGLAIVKHLVIALGWHMKFESVEEKGMTVRLYFEDKSTPD